MGRTGGDAQGPERSGCCAGDPIHLAYRLISVVVLAATSLPLFLSVFLACFSIVSGGSGNYLEIL